MLKLFLAFILITHFITSNAIACAPWEQVQIDWRTAFFNNEGTGNAYTDAHCETTTGEEQRLFHYFPPNEDYFEMQLYSVLCWQGRVYSVAYNFNSLLFSKDCKIPGLPEQPPVPPDSTLPNLSIRDDGLNISLSNGNPIVVNGAPLNCQSNSNACAGDPVNLASGFMWHETTDFNLAGRTPLTNLFFQRTYLAHPVLPVKTMGTHWINNFQTSILALNIGGKTSLMWTDETGGAYVFIKNADGSYKNPGGFFGSLAEFSDRYELIKSNQQKFTYSKNGKLQSISEPHGEKITLTYDSAGFNLISVQTNLAGKILFFYDANNYLIKVTRERDNLSYNYAYDVSGNLISVTDFNGLKTSYTYNSTGLMLSFSDPLGRSNFFT